MDNKTAAVKMRNITKTFGSVVANDKVWLDIYRGEILALLGENGSGKTTLMNMLSGIYFPDEGEISIDGKEVVIRSPKDAYDLGIGMVHQHFKLVDVLTATENIVLGLKEKGKLDLKAAARSVGEKSVAMIHVADINKVTGYVRGGCSPVGMKKQYKTVFDESVLTQQKVYVSGGRIGTQVCCAPADLIRAARAATAKIIF